MAIKLTVVALALAITSFESFAALVVIEQERASATPVQKGSVTPFSPFVETIGAQSIGNSSFWYDSVHLKAITYVGKPPHEPVPSLIGQGRSVKFKDAMDQMVPSKFRVVFSYGSQSELVDWQAAGNWLGAVDSFLSSKNMSGILDWRSSTLTLNGRGGVSFASKATLKNKKIYSKPPMITSVVIGKGFLRDELDKAKYKLGVTTIIWSDSIPECLDWPIHSSFSINLSDKTKAIAEVFKGYPLIPKYYRADGTLEIIPAKPLYQYGECSDE